MLVYLVYYNWSKWWLTSVTSNVRTGVPISASNVKIACSSYTYTLHKQRDKPSKITVSTLVSGWRTPIALLMRMTNWFSVSSTYEQLSKMYRCTFEVHVCAAARTTSSAALSATLLITIPVCKSNVTNHRDGKTKNFCALYSCLYCYCCCCLIVYCAIALLLV